MMRIGQIVSNSVNGANSGEWPPIVANSGGGGEIVTNDRNFGTQYLAVNLAAVFSLKSINAYQDER